MGAGNSFSLKRLNPPFAVRFQGLNNSFSLWWGKCLASIKVDSKFAVTRGGECVISIVQCRFTLVVNWL